MTAIFTDDEIETIKSIIEDHGSDCSGTDSDKVLELKYKLGLEKRPTLEEIAEWERKRKEWAESPHGKAMIEILNASNHLIPDIYNQLEVDVLYGTKDLIGSTLRIRLPDDYQVKED